MKNSFALAAAIFLLFISFWPRQMGRGPASLDEAFWIEDYLAKIDQSLARDIGENSCQQVYGQLYDDFYHSDIGQIKVKNFAAALQKSFELRLALRLKAQGKCVSSVTSLNRLLRYLEDYLIERKSAELLTFPEDDFVTFRGKGDFFQKNPKFKFENEQDLQSGDVILSRGNAFTSAAIARITKNPGQFSHISMVYRDEAGKLWTIESHIEIGAVVAPIKTHIEEKNARSVVLRFYDAEKAHLAAKAIFEHVRSYLAAKSKNIQYDFGMSLEDTKDLFCSEVVHKGFLDSSGIDVPLRKSTFREGILGFLDPMGIDVDSETVKTFETFAPSDIEYDPRFALVAEWRNPVKMRKIRVRDAIMTSLFNWMSEKNYQFHYGLGLNLKSAFAWLLRHLPFVKKAVIEKFPVNMKAKQIRLFLTLDQVAEPIEQELIQKVKGKESSLSFKDLMTKLEQIREVDSMRKEPLFHKRYRP